MFRAANGKAERSGHLRIIHGNSRARRARTCGPEGLVADARGGAGREGLDADDDAEREDDEPHVRRRGCVRGASAVIARDLQGASVRTNFLVPARLAGTSRRPAGKGRCQHRARRVDAGWKSADAKKFL